VTVVVGGTGVVPRVRPDLETLRAAVSDRENGGQSRRDAIVDVAQTAGVPKREVYDAVHRDA
jgi:16S rRNA (cytidine1402-2'-O)-methyltransferase